MRWVLGGAGEDATSAMGWRIANNYEFRTAISTGGFTTDPAAEVLQIRINGTFGGIVLSSDATLSALALEDASDDSTITISPVFASGTTSYTADVDNGVDEITIKPTVNEGNATFEYLDSSDTAITDANSGKTGQQISLSEGANTIKVKVTAQDTTTTNPYTVVVTRAATEPGAPTGLAATANGASRIDLAWTAPGDTGGAAITGYRIEVSPDGASDWTDLVADTASTATTYAHTGLSAVTTRHYRVSAINAVGASVPSGSAEATTGAAPGSANVLVSNIGHHTSSESLPSFDVAQAFTTGANATGYTLTSIELRIETSVSTTPTVKLYSGSATGTEEATLTGPPMLAGIGTAIYAFTPSSAVTLLGSTTYWVVVESAPAWIQTSLFTEIGTPATGWSIANGYGFRDASSTGSFTASTTGAYQIRVNGNTVAAANTAPTGADNTLTIGSDTAYTFAADDFGFADADTADPADMLASVRIESLPALGELALDGTAVSLNDVIPSADIGDLAFTPVAGGSGDDYASFMFKVNDGTDFSASANAITFNVTPANTAPTSADGYVEADEDMDYTFSSADFPFTDTAGDSLASVKVVTLPASGTGTLTLSGTTIGSGDLPKTVLAAEIDDLKYSPPANLYGTDFATFTFKVNDGTVDSDNAYTMNIDVKGEDDPATGKPGITGMAQVGQTLTATAGTIADLDGLPDPFISAAFTTIQWIQVDGATETDISGATNETYTLATADAGKKIKVKVSFEDEDGAVEGPLTSDAYPASATVTAAPVTNTAPVFSSSNVSRSIAENTAADVNVGAAVTATDAGDTLAYTLGGTDMASFDIVGDSGQIRTKTGVSYDFEAKSSYTVTATATDTSNATAVATVTIGITDVAEPPDAPPTISVSAVAGSTTSLTVSWTAPANAGRPAIDNYDVQYRLSGAAAWTDGPQNVTTTTANVTGLVADTLYEVQVRATNAEGDSGWSDPPVSGRTNSPPNTAPTSADGYVEADEDFDYTFSFDDFDFTDTDTGDSLASVKIVTLPASGTGTLTLSGTTIGSGDLPQTVLAAEINNLKYSPAANLYGTDVASFTFKVNDGTVDSDNAYTMNIDVKGEDDAATGKPGITGTAQVGERLTATAGTIADLDGLPDPFISAAFTTIQWIQVDGATETDISGATNETYTLATADAGKKIKVKVSFEDEDGAAEGPLTSDAYPASGTVTAAPVTNTPPTAANNTVTTAEDRAYAFTADDFGFADTDTGDVLASVKIVTLPGLGTLAHDGTAVEVDDVVVWDDIEDDKLTFTPALDAHGDPYTTFTFKVNDGTVDSADAYTMTIDVTDAPAPVCTAPSYGDRREIWSGTVTVEEFSFLGSVTGYGFQSSTGISSLLPRAEFSIGSSDHTISAISVGVSGTLIVTVDANELLTATEEAALRLHVCDENLDFSSASAVSAGYAWTGTRDWSDPVVTRTLYLSLPANTAATGEPAITGTARVGQELTATTGAIADDDGLPSSFTYQWLRVDADGASNEEDISGEIAATYTLTNADVGKKVKVKVSFTDELSGEETRTSAAYPSSGTVTAAGANTASVLVSNFGQMTGDSSIDRDGVASQAFTTGSNNGGYSVSSVELISEDTQGDSFSISVCSTNSSSIPVRANCTALTPPSDFAAGTLSFTAQPNIDLEADTTYALLVESTSSVVFDTTTSDSEDAASQVGWEIANAYQFVLVGDIWSTTVAGASLRIAIKGTLAGATTNTNTAPTAANNTVTTGEDRPYTFTADDFEFADDDAADTLASVKIVAPPALGALALDGAAVTADAVVTKAQIDADMLIFTPARDAHGDPYTTFTFKVNDGTVDSAERLHDDHRRDGRPRPRLHGAQLRRPAPDLDRYGDGGAV